MTCLKLQLRNIACAVRAVFQKIIFLMSLGKVLGQHVLPIQHTQVHCDIEARGEILLPLMLVCRTEERFYSLGLFLDCSVISFVFG